MIAPQGYNPQEQTIRNQPAPAPVPVPEQPNNEQPELANNQPAEEVQDSIKNNSNKNEDIPDVPIPPLPTTLKKQEQQNEAHF
jgi:hypothetical protein